MSDSTILNSQQKLDLANMIKANEADDFTNDIRNKRQSQLIRNDIKQMLFLKEKYSRLSKSNPNEFDKICVNQCKFLFNNYTDIYNKIKNDTLNLTIFSKFLDILKQIEDGELNQHEGSYLVGKHLKEMYIDSALKKSEKLDKKYGSKEKEVRPKNITWKQYKEQNLIN